jgi:hypothetical protein
MNLDPIKFVSPSPSPSALALAEIYKVSEALSASETAIAEISRYLREGDRETVSEEIASDADDTTHASILQIFHAREALARLASEASDVHIRDAHIRATLAYQDLARINVALWDALRFSSRSFGRAYFVERSERLALEARALLASLKRAEAIASALAS